MKRLWIRGPALKTVLALGLRVGDEVKLKACDAKCGVNYRDCMWNHAGLLSNALFRGITITYIETTNYAGGGEIRTPPILVRRYKDRRGTFVHLHNIRAWRPGVKK